MADPITVVVPTRDRPALLHRCLEALRSELDPEDRLVVVDSAPAAHPVGDDVRRLGAEVLLAALPGTSRARNLGWRAATTSRVVFVDDDVLVAPGWRRAWDATTGDFVFGGVEQHPDDAPHERPVSLALRRETHVVDRAGPLDPGIAGNLLVRRDALVHVGGFDDRFGPASWFASAEDLDLLDRLVLAGYVGSFAPAALAWHVQWRDDRQALDLHWAYGKGMGGRLARLLRTDRTRARLLVPQVLRLGGVVTAAAEVAGRRRRHWGPPIVWRVGALAGFVVGVVRRV